MLGSLLKAAVGTVLTPVALAADVVTLGGALTDKRKPYTAQQLSDILRNLEDATKPNSGRR